MSDDLFDDGINGVGWDNQNEAWADDYYQEDDYREDFDVCNANGLEIKGWPTYGNYTIITDTFHMYWWPGNNTIDIFDLRLPDEAFPNCHQHVLTLKNKDLYLFGDKTEQREDGKWGIDFHTGAQVNEIIQRYINLRAFI